MCTWITQRAEVAGSGKGPDGWFALTHANVYFDHPYHAPFEHTLNIDFVDEAAGPGTRVAVEMEADSARALAHQILAALAAGEEHAQDQDPDRSGASDRQAAGPRGRA
ncbi:MAG: DUF6295 family protein [Streptomycetales bacterium]